MKKLFYIFLLVPFLLFGQDMDDVKTVQVGNTDIKSIQAGSTTIWSGGGIDVSNLVAYWDFEQNGTDEMGNHNATITNGTYNASGKIGYSMSPNGTSGSAYGRVADSDDFSPGNGTTDTPFSVTMWVQIDQTNDESWLLCKRDGNTSLIEWEIVWDDASPGSIKFILFDGTSGNRIEKVYDWTPTASTWYHLAFTYDGSGNHTGMTIYLDKVSVSTSSGEVGTYVAMENTTALVTISTNGTNPDTSFNNHNGEIDLVTYWDGEELTSDKVAAIYDKENGGSLITE